MIQKLLGDNVAIEVSFEKHQELESIYIKYIRKLAIKLSSYQYYKNTSLVVDHLYSQHIAKYKILMGTYYFFILNRNKFIDTKNTIRFAVKRTNINAPTKREKLIKKDTEKLKKYLDYFNITVNIIFDVNDLFRMMK